jgi:hypothetical protein
MWSSGAVHMVERERERSITNERHRATPTPRGAPRSGRWVREVKQGKHGQVLPPAQILRWGFDTASRLRGDGGLYCVAKAGRGRCSNVETERGECTGLCMVGFSPRKNGDASAI